MCRGCISRTTCELIMGVPVAPTKGLTMYTQDDMDRATDASYERGLEDGSRDGSRETYVEGYDKGFASGYQLGVDEDD